MLELEKTDGEQKMIFSIFASIALILSICIKERKKSLFVQSLNCLFESIYYYCIEAFTGAVLGLVNFIRTFIFMQSEKINRKIYFLMLIIFEGIIITNCIYIIFNYRLKNNFFSFIQSHNSHPPFPFISTQTKGVLKYTYTIPPAPDFVNRFRC